MSRKFKFHWNLTRITDTLDEDRRKFVYLVQLFLEWEMFHTKVVAKTGTHNFLLFPENHEVYEIMWKGTVEPGRPQLTIWRMRVAYWIPKATNARSEYVIFIAFPFQLWLHKCAWMLQQMLRWFPTFQVATTCFSCSPPDLNLLLTNFIFCVHVK